MKWNSNVPSDAFMDALFAWVTLEEGNVFRERIFSWWYKKDKVGITSYMLQALQKLADAQVFRSLDDTAGRLATHVMEGSSHSSEDVTNSTRHILHRIFVEWAHPTSNTTLDIWTISRYLDLMWKLLLWRNSLQILRELRSISLDGALDSPIPLLVDYLLPKFSDLRYRFQWLKKEHNKRIKIPNNNQNTSRWQQKSKSVTAFIDGSIKELEDIESNILAYTRQPMMLINMLARIQREIDNITHDQNSLHSEIADTIRISRSTDIATRIRVEDTWMGNQNSQSLILQKLQTLSLRIDNIGKKLSQPSSILWRFLSQQQDLFEELEKISEQLRSILLQYPEMEERIRSIMQRIDHVRWTETLKLQQSTSRKAEWLLTWSDRIQNIHVITPDEQIVIGYIESLIVWLRSVTSTKGNSVTAKKSKWDGSIREDVVSPLLRLYVGAVRNWWVDAHSFSWSEVLQNSDIEFNSSNWKRSSHLFANYTQKWDLSQNLDALSTILLDQVWEVTNTKLDVLKPKLKECLQSNPPPSR